MAKYRNKKVIVDGIEFDSKREAKRWSELRILERAGEIQHLSRQVKFVLIPTQYAVTGYTKTNKPIRKCIERECSYVADFTYQDDMGVLHVEDVKGFRTETYKIKRKLMLYVHGIEVKEI